MSTRSTQDASFQQFDGGMWSMIGRSLLWLFGLNVVPLLFNFPSVFGLLLLGAVALVLPQCSRLERLTA